jgi:hypothetical protein
MNLKDVGRAGVDWIHLVHDGDHWRALMYAATKLRVL